jgi:hypothetical protein
MPVDSPKAQIFGGKAACVSQRVEDNAFHLRKLTRIENESAAPDSMVRSKVDRLLPNTMPLGLPKTQEIFSYVAGSLATLAQ